MSPKLAALLVTLAALGGGIAVYTLGSGAQVADPTDAGLRLGDYPLHTISAAIRYDSTAEECMALPDGGHRRSPYATRNLFVRFIPCSAPTDMSVDGGCYYADWQPKKLDGGPCVLAIRPEGIEWKPNDDGGLPDNSAWCACRPNDGGVCNVDRPPLADGGPDLLPDGGQRRMAGPLGRLLQPEEHPAGPGCERTPCVVIAGYPSGECGLP